MSLQPTSRCELCQFHPAKVLSIQNGEMLIDICERCHQQTAKDKLPRHRDSPGQKLFPFMRETSDMAEPSHRTKTNY